MQFRSLLTASISILLVGFIWQWMIVALHVPNYVIPAPDAIISAAVAERRILILQAGFTLRATLIGILVSLGVAVCCAVGFTRSRRVERAALPLLVAFRSAPVPAIAPIAMLLFGRGLGTSILVVTIVSFFPLLVNLMRGLASVDRDASELFHVYGASFWQVLGLLRFPAALPFLFSGLRMAGSIALLGAMLSEWITGSHGLGNLILESADMRETELLWAAVLMSVAIAMTLFWVAATGERLTTRGNGKVGAFPGESYTQSSG